MAITFDIGFRADAKDIQGLQTIQREVQAAFAAPTGGKGMSDEIAKAVKQAQILETTLKKATTDKGISFMNMQLELKKAGTSAAEMVATLAKAGPAFSGSLNTFLNSFAMADRSLIGISSKIKEMGRVVTQSFKFSLAQEGIQFVTQNIQEAISWVKDLNDELTTISIVSGKTADQMDKVYDTIIKGAKELRVAAQDYAEASTIFYQQGLNDAEVERRTQITIKAAQAAGQSTQEMSKQLTAIWNTYRMSGDQMENAASVGAKLGAETAVEFKDIAEAMQISAAAASQMGVSYNSLAAIIATVGDATQQSASVIGNAYKTIFSRFEQLKSAGTDGEVTLGQVSSQLRDLGVNVLDGAGELRKLDDVITEVGNNWSTYSEKQQLAIAELVGGTRQYGQFLSLMANFDKYQKNLASANGETGAETLDKQYKAALESIDSAMTNSAEAWHRAFSKIFTSDSQKEFYRGLERIGNIFENIIDTAGGLQGILTLVGAYLIRKIYPAGVQIKDIFQQWRDSLTVDSQLNALHKDIESMSKAVTEVHYSGASTGQEVADAQANNAYDQEKLKTTEAITQATIQLNAAQKVGTQEVRNQVESYKQALSAAQKRVNATLDEMRSARDMSKQQDIILKAQQKRIKMLQSEDRALTDQEKTQKRIVDSKLQLSKIIKTANSAEEGSAAKMAGEVEELVAKLPTLSKEAQESAARLNDMTQAMRDGGDADFGNNIVMMSEELTHYADALSKGSAEEQVFAVALRQYISGLQEAGIRQVELGEGQQQVNNLLDSIKNRFTAAGTSIQAYGQALLQCVSQAAMLATGVSNLISTISSGDATFAGVASQLAFMIPTAIALAKSFSGVAVSTGKMVAGLIASIPGLAGTSIGQTMNAIAAGEWSAANLGLWATLWPILLIIGLIAVAIGALVGIVYGIVKAFEAWKASTPEGKLDAAKEAAERMANELDRVKQEAEELKSAFDNYNSLVDQLNDCTRGTAEWREALQNVNDSVMDILEKYPELAAMEGAITRTADGMLQISEEAQAAMREAADKQVATVRGASYAQNQRVREAQINVDQKNLTSTLTKAGNGISGTTKYTPDGYAYSVAGQDAAKIASRASDLAGKTQDEIKVILDSMGLEGSVDEWAAEIANLGQDFTALANSIDANTRAVEIENQAIADTALADVDLGRNGETLQAMGGEMYAKLYNDVYEQYKKDAADRGWFNTGTDTSKDTFKKYMEAMGIDDYKVKNYKGNGDVEYEVDGEKVTVTEEEIAAVLAAQYATEQLAGSLEGLNDKITALSVSTDKADEALLDFLTKDDLSNMTEDQLQAMLGKMGADDISDIDSQAIVDYLTTALGDADLAAQFAPKLEEQLANAAQALDPDAMVDAMGSHFAEAGAKFKALVESDDMGDLTAGQMQQLANAYQRIFDVGGEELLNATDEMIRAAGDQGEDMAQIISSINWGSWEDADRFAEELDKLGIEMDSKTVQAYVDQMRQANHAMHETSLKEFTDQFADLQSKFADIKIGDIISAEDYGALGEESKGYFQLMADGTYQLTKDANKFYNALKADNQKAILGSVQEAKQNLNTATEKKGNFGDQYLDEKYGKTANYYDAEKDQNFYNSGTTAKQIELIQQFRAELNLTADEADRLDQVIAEVGNGQSTVGNIAFLAELAQRAQEELGATNEEIEAQQQALYEAQSAYAGTASSLEELDMLMAQLHQELGDAGVSYDAYSNALLGLASQYENTAAEAKAYAEALERGDKDAIKTTEDSLRAATAIGQAAAKYDLSADTLEAHAKLIQQNNKEMNLSAEQAAKLAIANERMNKGVSKLNSGIEDWSKTLKTADKRSQDYAETVVEITDAVGDLLGQMDDFELPEGFLDSEENLELLQKAAEGDQLAINTLGVIMGEAAVNALEFDQALVDAVLASDDLKAALGDGFGAEEFSAAKDIVLQGIQDIQANMEALTAGTMTLDEAMGGSSASWVESLNQMAMATGMSVDEMNAMLNSLGVQAKVDVVDVPQTVSVPEYTEYSEVSMSSPATYNADHVMTKPPTWQKKTWTAQTGTREVDGVVQVAQISTEDNPMTPAVSFTGVGGGHAGGGVSPSSTGSGGSKGGGGGSSGSFSEKKESKSDSVAERYANIQSSIDKTTRAIERYSEAADDAWGAAKFKNLKAINNQLQIQAKKLQILQKEAEEYYKKDQGDLLQLLGDKGIQTAKFNSDGFVSNRENILKQLDAMRQPYEDALNQLIRQYNAGGVANEALEEQIDKAQKALDNFVEETQDQVLAALDQVDETAQKVFDVMQERLENIRQWMSNKVEMAGIKLDIGLAIDETDIRVMNHLIDLWGDLGTEMGKTWQWYKKNVESYYSEMNRYMSNASRMNEILDHINPDGTVSLDGEDQSWFEKEFGKDAWEKYINGNGGLPEEVIDQLQDDVDNLMDTLENAQDAMRSMLQEWVKLFEMYMERFDKISDKIAASNETLDMYTNLMTAMGKDQTAAGTKAMLNIAKATYANARASADVAKAKMTLAREQMEQEQARLDEFLNGRTVDQLSENEVILYQELKGYVDTAEEYFNEAASEFKNGVSEMASAFTAEMEAATNAMRAAVIEDLGGVFTDWDTMLEMYGMKKEQNQWWLDLLTKDYELDKLGTSIQDYMDNNAQLDSLSQYQELLEEVNSLLGEGVEMNQTDLEVLQKRFELMQAQDAYEEAMNNKNTMRLTRDASGNYSYVYSGDSASEDAAAQNLQKVKDLTYEIEKLQQDAAAEAEELWLNTYARIMQLDEERNTARYQNDEQYRKYIDEQLAIESENLERYANEISKRYDAINKKFTESELYWLLGEQHMEDGTKVNLDNMDEFHRYFVEKHHGYAEQLDATGKEYVENFEEDVKSIGEGTEELGGDWETLEDKVNEYTGYMMDESEDLRAEAWNLESEANLALTTLAGELYDNAMDMISYLDDVTDAIYRQIEALQKLREEQLANIEKAEQEADEQDSPDDYVDPNANKPAETPKQEEKSGPADAATIASIAEAIWIHGSSATGWGTGATRQARIDERYGAGTGAAVQAYINAHANNGDLYRSWASKGYPGASAYPHYLFGGLADFTGPAWLDGSKTNPELVLNADDTKNILSAVQNMRQLVAEKALTLGSRNLGGASLDVLPGNGQVVQQQVQIDATFPNVSVAAEVEEALNNLLRQVAQYNIDR